VPGAIIAELQAGFGLDDAITVERRLAPAMR